MNASADGLDPAQVARELDAFILHAVGAAGGDTRAVRPGHRVKFHWPPHPVSYEYHVLPSDWKGKAELQDSGERFEVDVAVTPWGTFGRCDALWLEARGDDVPLMLRNLGQAAQPLLKRQRLIAATLGREGRFTESVRDLAPVDLLKLLYCQDRDVANDAREAIETHEHAKAFLPGLMHVLNDRRHPYRRSAQWCVLDLFEDLPSFLRAPEQAPGPIEAIQRLIWEAEDDYARTIYKAGVVLGGHLAHLGGGEALLECLSSPSRFGRRSAIHGLFHVVEWLPDLRARVVAALRACSDREEIPDLRDFARDMARDIGAGAYDHIPEPVFPEEK